MNMVEKTAAPIDAVHPHPSKQGEWVLRILEEEGLIGCIEGDGGLSTQYKQHLWADSD